MKKMNNGHWIILLVVVVILLLIQTSGGITGEAVNEIPFSNAVTYNGKIYEFVGDNGLGFNEYNRRVDETVTCKHQEPANNPIMPCNEDSVFSICFFLNSECVEGYCAFKDKCSKWTDDTIFYDAEEDQVIWQILKRDTELREEGEFQVSNYKTCSSEDKSGSVWQSTETICTYYADKDKTVETFEEFEKDRRRRDFRDRHLWFR